ncbi:MAG TPA: FecR domain-containing protein [Spirochaetota bacterium]|nr:FecR domain-containing protein [Spirochaetota bacterium]HPJ35180.1 FecR domain-containing protein [Spirochaetota bacterium]
MKNIRILLLFALFSVFIVFSCGKKDSPLSESEGEFDFKIQFVLGDVKIAAASGEKAAVQGDIVAVSDVITTGKKSVADLIYGKSGVIRINENSRVTVTSIAAKTGSDTVMDMNNGKVFLTLTKLKGTGFKVKTPTAVASVRGTSFTVTSNKRGAKLAVVKGTVAVNPVKEGKIIEEKTVSVETGKTTDYINETVVEQVITGKMEIPVMDMTPAEKIEIQAEVKEIKIEEIPDLTLEIKEEIINETVAEAVVEEKQDVKADDSAKKAEEEALAKKLAEEKKRKAAELKKQEEERLKKEEEMRKLAEEEKKKKEEKLKKERASNIPTM